MNNWGFVLLSVLSLTLNAQTLHFHGTGQASASLSSIANYATDSGPANINIKFDLPGLDLNPAADGFSTVKAKNLFPIEVTGNPDVQVSGSLFVIPPGYEPKLKIVRQETTTVKDVVVEPAQHKVRCNCGDLGFAFNSALYKSSTLYPANVASLESIGRFQEVRFGRVLIQPIQQDFEKETVVVTTKLEVEVSFEQVSRNVDRPALSALAERLASTLTPNSDDVTTESETRKALETMIVFTHESYKDALKPLIEWKQLRGIEVKVFTLTELGGTKESAKEFLQKLYNDSPVKPSYLLVVGDKTTFPAFEEKTTTGAGVQMAITDYPYSLLSGDDAIPDLLYGRLLVSNVDELKTQITKIVSYERTPEKDAWYTKGTTIASDEGSNPSDKDYALQVQDSLKKFTFKEMDSLFQGDQTAKEESILKAVNEGRSWITYIGHGTGTSWGSVNDKFDLQSIEKLTNSRYSVLIDVACENANYKSINVPFGKAWMTQTSNGKPVGTAGYYGGSVSISWHPPAIMATGIAKAHFEKPVYTFGGSVLAGQLFLIEKIGSNDKSIDNLRWYNLLGDPSMLVRTDAPKALSVERGKRDKRGNFQFKVLSGGAPVFGAVASVITEGGKVASVKTAADGTGELPFSTRLVVSGYNLETVEQDLK